MINFSIQVALYSCILFLFEKQYLGRLYTKLISLCFLKKNEAGLARNEYITKEKNKVENEDNGSHPRQAPLTFKIDNVTKLYFPLCAPKIYAVNEVKLVNYLN